MDNTVHIRKSYTIPDDVVKTIIEMAGYGIAYWADEAQYDDVKRTYKVLVSEDDEVFTITYQQIAEALVLVGTRETPNYIDKYARDTLMEIQDGEEFPGGYIDADLADVVVQLAIYGEVIYG